MRIGIPWHLPAIKSLPSAKSEPFKRLLAVLKHAIATLVHDVQIPGAEEYKALPIPRGEINHPRH